MSKIIIGSQLYTFRNEIKDLGSLEKVLKKVKNYGCDAVQLSGVNIKASASDIRKVADDAGVVIPVTHTPFDRIFNDTERVAEEHIELGAHSVGLGMAPAEYRSADGLEKLIETANEIAERLKPFGLKFAYHNHAHEFKKIGDTRILDELFARVPDMEFIFDTFWCRYAKCDPVDYLTRFSGRITDIHLKDWAPSLIVPKIRDVGKGKLDFKSILSVAEEGGTRYAYIEHDFTRDPYKTTRESVEHIATIY